LGDWKKSDGKRLARRTPAAVFGASRAPVQVESAGILKDRMRNASSRQSTKKQCSAIFARRECE
jgi:hypothetical protein